MGRQEKTIHYIYKTICLVTGRYYIGMHSTCNLDDGYMGSGKRLRHSIRKYGIDNHKKEIIEFFETRELLVEAEIKSITSDMITDRNCMNIMSGGTGGFVSLEACAKGGKNAIDKIHQTQWITNGEKNRERLANVNKEKWKDKKHRTKILKNLDWTDKQHSDETKKLMSDKAKKRIGKANPQYGTCWITKEGLNKKIKKEELDNYQLEGWVKGRKVNNEAR
jgi:hypothetical protein